MRAVHIERQQLAQRVPPVTIRQEPVPVRAQPVLEQLGERRVVLHVDHLGHLGGAGRRDDGRLRGLGGQRGRGGARGGALGSGTSSPSSSAIFLLIKRPPQRSTPFPYTTLFRPPAPLRPR